VILINKSLPHLNSKNDGCPPLDKYENQTQTKTSSGKVHNPINAVSSLRKEK
jgi:hypothetical protein